MLCGCAGSRGLHARPASAFDEQINRAIPIGTSIAQAEVLLTSNGYSCARPQGPGQSKSVLTCIDRGLSAGSLVERDWFIVLTHDANDRVTDIDATIHRAFAL